MKNDKDAGRQYSFVSDGKDENYDLASVHNEQITVHPLMIERRDHSKNLDFLPTADQTQKMLNIKRNADIETPLFLSERSSKQGEAERNPERNFLPKHNEDDDDVIIATGDDNHFQCRWYFWSRATAFQRNVRALVGSSSLFQNLNHNAISDEAITIRGIILCEGPELVRLLKFLLLTIGLIVIIHPFVRFMGWEYDSDFSIHDFFLYDFHHVCLDILSFFIVGRLFRRRGTDRLLTCILPMVFGAIQPSWSGNWKFLKYSVSLYEVMCRWPWKLFLYVTFVAVFISGFAVMHVIHLCRKGIFFSRLFELGLCVGIFLLPLVSNPNFHFHHWYASWLFGMHSNMGTWWSDVVIFYAWGTYINGIAVYGRDPLLPCAYAFYLSTDNRCYFMECYFNQDDNDNEDHYKSFVSPDWRNCSASNNYIP